MCMVYATRDGFCGLGLKTISGGFSVFEPQNPGGDSNVERKALGSIEHWGKATS